jgi:outer membrane protein
VNLPAAASAETIAQALAATYANNPTINSARADVRAVEENVAIAKGGLRPNLSAFSNGSGSSIATAFSTFESVTYQAALGLQVEQPLFRGFQVVNAIREAEIGVKARREFLRNTTQNTLFDAAQTYLDVVLAGEIRELRRRNVAFLFLQVGGIEKRFAVGDVTRTDVAQGKARLGAAEAAAARADDAFDRLRADYRRLVGHDAEQLAPAFPYRSLVPPALPQALEVALDGHPFILASLYQADAQGYEVKRIEGALLPSVSVIGTMQHNESFNTEAEFRNWSNAVAIEGRLSIPLYQGGTLSGRIRQAKELQGELQIEVDLARDEVRDAIVSAWASIRSTEREIAAAADAVRAAELALSGVQKELRVGQRTTLDVLDAEHELLSVRESLAGAERDRLVAQFSLLSAMGRLNADDLRLATEVYDPAEHYQAVHDKWFGTTTPDGR